MHSSRSKIPSKKSRKAALHGGIYKGLNKAASSGYKVCTNMASAAGEQQW
jgi:hypothetical protein